MLRAILVLRRRTSRSLLVLRGLSWVEAVETPDLGEYATRLDAERVVVNVYQRYRQLDLDTQQLQILALLVMQAEWLAKRCF